MHKLTKTHYYVEFLSMCQLNHHMTYQQQFPSKPLEHLLKFAFKTTPTLASNHPNVSLKMKGSKQKSITTEQSDSGNKKVKALTLVSTAKAHLL